MGWGELEEYCVGWRIFGPDIRLLSPNPIPSAFELEPRQYLLYGTHIVMNIIMRETDKTPFPLFALFWRDSEETGTGTW